jgi:hypothetical protein
MAAFGAVGERLDSLLRDPKVGAVRHEGNFGIVVECRQKDDRMDFPRYVGNQDMRVSVGDGHGGAFDG